MQRTLDQEPRKQISGSVPEELYGPDQGPPSPAWKMKASGSEGALVDTEPVSWSALMTEPEWEPHPTGSLELEPSPSCPTGHGDMHLGGGLPGSKGCILSPSSHGKRVKHAIDILCLGDFHIKKAPFRISTSCQIGLLVKFSCATQNCQSKKLHGKCPWRWAGHTRSALLAHCLAVTVSMPALFSWRDILNWPRNSSAAGRNLAGGKGGKLLNPVASFLFVLIWKNCCGHLETLREPVIESGDSSLPMKHLRHYPELCSVPGWWCELPANRTLFLYIQGISWTTLCQFIPSGSGLNRRRSAMLFLFTLCLMNQ